MYERTNVALPYYCAPAQPAYTPVEWQPVMPTFSDVFNAAVNQYLKDNWQDILKWFLQELARPTPTRRRRRR